MSAMIACAAYSQSGSGNDTICLPQKAVIRLIQSSDSLNILKPVFDSMMVLQGVLMSRLSEKDSTIYSLTSAVSRADIIMKNYQMDQRNLEEQKRLLQLDIKSLERSVRRQRAKSTFFASAGVTMFVALVLKSFVFK